MRKGLGRRAALGIMLGTILGCIPGCGAAGILIKLPWDRILSVLVNVADLVAIITGWLDGAEKQTEVPLTADEVQRLERGEEIVVELKDGSKQRIRPTLQK